MIFLGPRSVAIFTFVSLLIEWTSHKNDGNAICTVKEELLIIGREARCRGCQVSVEPLKWYLSRGHRLALLVGFILSLAYLLFAQQEKRKIKRQRCRKLDGRSWVKPWNVAERRRQAENERKANPLNSKHEEGHQKKTKIITVPKW